MIKSFDNSLETNPQNFNKIDQIVFLLYLSNIQCKVSFFVQYRISSLIEGKDCLQTFICILDHCKKEK